MKTPIRRVEKKGADPESEEADHPRRFTGKERDAETNNDYFGARYYGSTAGRFLSPDWSAEPTAVPYAAFGNPQSLNLYTYTRNNPVTGVDPNGHLTTPTELDREFAMAAAANGILGPEQALQQAQQQSGTVPVVVGQRPIQNKWAQFFSILFTFHKAYHSYYRLEGHQFEVLGDSGSSHNQQVRDTYGTTRQSNGGANHEHTVYATEAQASALINRSEYYESHPCPVCTGGEQGYNLIFHNSNSFVYNMLSRDPAGGIPPPSAPFITPGYALKPDDWY